MSSASSLLYYLGLNSIDDEVSRLNNSSSVPFSSFTLPELEDADNGHDKSCRSSSVSSPESTQIELQRARGVITETLKKQQNRHLAPAARSTSNNNISKTTTEPKCNFCGKYGADACCGACRSTFYCSKKCQVKDWQDGKHWKVCPVSINNDTVASASTLVAPNNAFPNNNNASTNASATSTHTISNRNASRIDLYDPCLFAKAPAGLSTAAINNNHAMPISGLINPTNATKNANLRNQDPSDATMSTNIAGSYSSSIEETAGPISHFNPSNAFRDFNSSDEEKKEGGDSYNHYDNEGSNKKGRAKDSLLSRSANSSTRHHSYIDFDKVPMLPLTSPTLSSSPTPTETLLSTVATARDAILNRAIQQVVDETFQKAQLHLEQQKHMALSHMKKELEQVHHIDETKAIKEVEHKVRMEVLELYKFEKKHTKLTFSQNGIGTGLGSTGGAKDGNQISQQQLQQKLLPQLPEVANNHVTFLETMQGEPMIVPAKQNHQQSQQSQKQQYPPQPNMQKPPQPKQKPSMALQLQSTQPRQNEPSSPIKPMNHGPKQPKQRVSSLANIMQPEKIINDSVSTDENISTETNQQQEASNSFIDTNEAISLQSSKLPHGYIHQNEVQIAITTAVEQAEKKLRRELTEEHNMALKEEQAKHERQLAEVIEFQAEEELDDAIGLLVGGVKGSVFAGIVGGAMGDGTEGKSVLANTPPKTKKDAEGASNLHNASAGQSEMNVNMKQIEQEFRKLWDQEKEMVVQEAAEAKELALKDLEALLVVEHRTSIKQLQQERSAVEDKLEKMKASYDEEKAKCKTEALISLNEKLHESKISYNKELEELEFKLTKEKNTAIATTKKRLHDAEEIMKKLKKEVQESKSNASGAVAEAVEKAIKQTTADHQTEIDRIKKKHDTKLQNFQALTKVDTERAIATAVKKALDTEKQYGGSKVAMEKIRSEANEQISGLKNELAELEKDREKLKLRLDIAEKWLKERDSLQIEVDQLMKDASMVDVSALKSKVSEQEETISQLRKERDSLQNEVTALKKEAHKNENEVATLKQAQEFNLKVSMAEERRPSALSHNTHSSISRNMSASPKLPDSFKDEMDNDPWINDLLNTPLPSKTRDPAEVATAPRSLSSSASFCSERSFKEVSKREGEISSKRGSEDPINGIRLMILNVAVTEAIEDMVDELGIWLVDDTVIGAATATHVIAGDNHTSLRRTPRFMVCISRTSNILHMDWLLNSYAEKRIVDCHKYMLINDSVAEKMYKFSMSKTLDEGNKRRKEGGLLSGWRIFICDGVAGNKAPKEEEFQMIIKASNGTLLKYSDINLLGGQDLAKTIVITSNPATSSQKADRKLLRLAKHGGHLKPAPWLFDCVINQQIKGI